LVAVLHSSSHPSSSCPSIPHLGGETTASIERRMLLPSVSYVLSWGETTGSVLVRIDSRSEKEVDRNKLARAIKAMKATLNGCILQEVKTEDLSCASTQQSTVPNLLKRPATLEGVSSTKRARVAEEDSTQDSTGEKTVEEEKTVLSPMSTVIKEVYPHLGKSTLENRPSRILTWSDDVTDARAAPSKTLQRQAEELAYFVNAGASCDVIPTAETIVRMLNQGDMTLIRENVQCLLPAEYQHELNVDRVIITHGLVKFIRHHHMKDQQGKDV
jgi:hypothetical protein